MSVKTWDSDVVVITIDNEKCVGSGECVSSCPGDVYDLAKGRAVVARVDDCIECCTCVSVCPEKAIWHSSCE